MHPAPSTSSLPAPSLPIIPAAAPPSTFQLVYLSSATAKFSQDELIALLDQSRQKNTRLGLSGILLYHDGNFLQLLEGGEQEVRALYARISRDPRHHGCLTLLSGRVAERTFPGWTMGFRDLASAEVKAMPGYNSFLNHDARGATFPTDPNRVMSLLRTFRASLIR